MKAGFNGTERNVVVMADEVTDLKLERILPLISDEIYRGIINGAPCDPQGWDARAPCHRILYTAAGTGVLKLEVTWTGAADVDMLIGTAYFEAVGHAIHGSVPVVAGRVYEIRLNAYYTPVPFEISASLFGQ